MSSAHQESSDEGSDGLSRKHRNYSAEFKLKVIQTALAGSKNSASKHYRINRRLVYDWIEKEVKIREQVSTSKHAKRLSGEGRSFKHENVEKELAKWVRMNSEATKKVLHDLDIHTAVIPGGCRKFIQASDVCWNSPFKAHIRSYYETWISNGDRMTFTSGGNTRAPSVEVYLDWIVRAWEALSKNLIINSFKVCGLTNASDGSEDDFIHCFKAHGPIPEGLEMLKEQRAKETAAEVSEEEDVEEDLANGYLSAEDEVIENEDLFEL